MHLMVLITTNFDAEKEEPHWMGNENYPPEYLPTEMIRDGLNDTLNMAGVGLCSNWEKFNQISCWTDFFKHQYKWIPTMRVAHVWEVPHNEDNWMHKMGMDNERREDLPPWHNNPRNWHEPPSK